MNISKILSGDDEGDFSAAFNKMMQRDRDHVAIGFFCIEDDIPWDMLEIAVQRDPFSSSLYGSTQG